MFYILYGKDKSMVSLKKRAIQIKHHIEDCILEFDATKDDCSLVLSEMDSMSIFDENKLIIIENATFLSSKIQQIMKFNLFYHVKIVIV